MRTPYFSGASRLCTCLRRVVCLGGLAAWVLIGPVAQAQTALIAHRSHGGAARTFVTDASVDNFGRVPIREDYERIKPSPVEAGEKLTVTKVVRRANGKVYRYGVSDVQGAVVYSFSQGFPFTDPAFTTRDAKAYFGPGVEIVGFDRKSRAASRAAQQAPAPARPAADTSHARPAAPAAPKRRRGLTPPVAALPPNRTGPTLLLVLGSVAAAALLWRWHSPGPKLRPA